jgi:hypothetical protein
MDEIRAMSLRGGQNDDAGGKIAQAQAYGGSFDGIEHGELFKIFTGKEEPAYHCIKLEPGVVSSFQSVYLDPT